MQYNDELKNRLESEYDIPFGVKGGIRDGERWVRIWPENEGRSLFEITLKFDNDIRLFADYSLQTFAGKCLKTMQTASADKKSAFCSFSKVVTEQGGKIEVSINGKNEDPYEWTNWPDEWKDFSFSIMVFPIAGFPNKPDYGFYIDKWGSLAIGMGLSLLDIVLKDDIESDAVGYAEGALKRTVTNRYERNRINRILCIKHFGYDCQICGMNFEQEYGQIGHDFIHVHHIVPVSQIGSDYIINPLEDLVPVCPNCHAMLHRTEPPLTPDVLRGLLTKRTGGQK